MPNLEDQTAPGTEGYLNQTGSARPGGEGMSSQNPQMRFRRKGSQPEEASPVLGELMAILEAWEQKEYATDRERWQSYADDIANLVAQYKG